MGLTGSVEQPPRYGLEVLLVLGVSLGQSAVYSVLRIVERLTRPEPLAQQTSTLNASVTPDRPWLDLTYQLVSIGFNLVPAALALYLLSRTVRPVGPALGLDARRPVFDVGSGWRSPSALACRDSASTSGLARSGSTPRSRPPRWPTTGGRSRCWFSPRCRTRCWNRL